MNKLKPALAIAMLLLIGSLANSAALAQKANTRTFSGMVVTAQFERVPGVSVEIETFDGKLQRVTDA